MTVLYITSVKATYLWSDFSNISQVPFLSLQAEDIKQCAG